MEHATHLGQPLVMLTEALVHWREQVGVPPAPERFEEPTTLLESQRVEPRRLLGSGDHPELAPDGVARVVVRVHHGGVVPRLSGGRVPQLELSFGAHQEGGDGGSSTLEQQSGERIRAPICFHRDGDSGAALQRQRVVGVVGERRIGAAPDARVVVDRLEHRPRVAIVAAEREQLKDRLPGDDFSLVAPEVHPDPRLPVLGLGILRGQEAGGAELLVSVVASEGGPAHPHAA